MLNVVIINHRSVCSVYVLYMNLVDKKKILSVVCRPSKNPIFPNKICQFSLFLGYLQMDKFVTDLQILLFFF